MKQCSRCKTTYTDDSLRFCLADGAPLDYVSETETVVSAPAGKQIRFDLTGEQRTVVSPARPQPLYPSEPQKKSASAMLVGVIAILVLVILVLGGFMALQYLKEDGNVKSVNSSTPAIAKTPAPDDETATLRNQITDLKRRMDQQKNPPSGANTQVDPGLITGRTVTVNSPGDGFLALRSEPNSETGSRMAKIPHGTAFTIGACREYIITARGNRGRWCTASYNGQSGYVFDAFVRYP
jgi:hypothetical protein